MTAAAAHRTLPEAKPLLRAVEAAMIKDVMVRLDGTSADEVRLAAADDIAEYFDSHIIGLFLNVLPFFVPPEAEGAAALASVQMLERAREFGDETEAMLTKRLRLLQKPVELRRFDVFSDTIGEIAAHEARSADTFVGLRPNGSSREPENIVEAVLFGSGRHLFLLPEREPVAHVFGHILIAWNESREAARAVAEAMPYLRKAEKVSVIVVDDDEPVESQAVIGRDLIEHLLHHGVGGGLVHVRKSGPVGSTLVAEARQRQADLVVMGGYGHSRLRQWLLGGATFDMMHHSPVPLLVAH
jgi:nucleotide-binding universal stress UspA family protein